MKTSLISKLNGYTSAILSLSLLALAAPACLGDASDGDEPSAPSDSALLASDDLDLAEVAVKPAPVRPAILPGVAIGEDLPAKPASSARSREASSLLSWTTSLSANPSNLWPTQFSTLTATANADVGPTPFFIRIRQVAGGTILATCGGGTTCSIPVTQPSDISVSYVSNIEDFSGNVQASSSPAVVNWFAASLNLSVSATTLPVGGSVTLTATTSRDIGPSPFSTQIFDVTTGTLLQSCGFGTSCSVSVSQAAASTHAYQAFLAPASATFPPPAAQRTTTPNYVTWANTGLSVSLSGPTSTGAFTQSVTATASIDVGPTPYFIEIFNQADGTRLAICGSGSTCVANFNSSYTSMPLVAFISANSTTLPPADGQASSNIVYSFVIIG